MITIKGEVINIKTIILLAFIAIKFIIQYLLTGHNPNHFLFLTNY